MDAFGEQLRARQAGLGDADFAARLGISQSYWTRIKHGQRPVTLTVARAAIAQWPDLEAVYLDGVRAALIQTPSGGGSAET